MGLGQRIVRVVLRAVIALPVVFSAEVLRSWLLEARGLGLPFLTYYPAVLIAAVLGGLPGGLVATLLSALLTVFRIHHGRVPWAEAVPMGIFVASGIWVSAMAHARLRAGRRADQALAGLERAGQEQHAAREQALGVSLAKLDALIHAVPDLVWLKDAEGVYQDCNAPFERFFGTAREGILGRTDYDLVDPELARSFREGDQQVMATGQVARSEETVALPEGPGGFLETIRTPIHDPAGAIIGVLGVGRDITQRKRDEDQIRRMTETLEEQVEDPAWAEAPAAGAARPSHRLGHLDDLLNPILADPWDRHCDRLELGAATLQAIEELSLGNRGRAVRAILAPALYAAGDHRLVSAALEHSRELMQAFTGLPPEGEAGAPAPEGFDLAYANRLFAAFQRLHASQDFERIYLASSWANFCWISASEKGLVIAKV